MATPEDVLARELRSEIDGRVEAWKRERALLLRAASRIAELDMLIAFAETDGKEQFKVAARVRDEDVDRTSEGPGPGR